MGKIDEVIKLYEEWQKLEPDNPIVEHMLAACSGENIPERASNDYVKETFDRFASSFDIKLAHLEYKAPQLIIEAIKSHIDDAKGTLNILDAGCGTGLCGPLLKPLAKNLSGVDLSQNMLNIAKQRKCYNDLVCDDLVKYLSKYTNKYDIIVSADTLIYFGDLNEALKAAVVATKPGALFVFSLEKLVDDKVDAEYKLEAHGRYTHNKQYIETTINDAGLELVSLDEEMIRKELGKPVDGWIVTAKKPG